MVWVLVDGDGLGTIGRLKNGNWVRWNAVNQKNGLVFPNIVFRRPWFGISVSYWYMSVVNSFDFEQLKIALYCN
jgi:hypothetical protein